MRNDILLEFHFKHIFHLKFKFENTNKENLLSVEDHF